MNINNKYTFITIIIFTILFVNLNYAHNNNKRLLLRCKKKCQNNNRKLKRFCKKCLSLDMLDKNKILDKEYSSIILLSNSTKFALGDKQYNKDVKGNYSVEIVCSQIYKNDLETNHAIVSNNNFNIKLRKFCNKCLRKGKKRYNYCKKGLALEILNSLNILLPEETLNEIIYNKKSISRYGDGEFNIIFGKNIRFQKSLQAIRKRLIDILNSNEDGLLVGLNNSLKYSHLDILKDWAANSWRRWLNKNKYKLINLLDINKQYGSAKISRFYIDYKEAYLNVPNYIKKLKEVWNNRDIVIIEGELSRLGIGNDLFDNSRSIQRIICPSKNAFELYDEIFKEALKIDKNKLILIALGPTATVLAYDLYKYGYQAIDIGHVDIEYEWYLRNATTKIKIEKKYVNVARNGNIDITDITDENYSKQIIVTISNNKIINNTCLVQNNLEISNKH